VAFNSQVGAFGVQSIGEGVKAHPRRRTLFCRGGYYGFERVRGAESTLDHPFAELAGGWDVPHVAHSCVSPVGNQRSVAVDY